MTADLLVLECYSNAITELNLTSLSELEVLNCGLNPLSTLDISENDSLVTLLIRQLPDGSVEHLDLSDKPNLEGLICMQNEGLVSVDLKNGNTDSDITIIGHSCPKFVCIEVDDLAHATDNWFINIEEYTAVTESCGLSLEERVFDNIDIYPIPANTVLTVNGVSDPLEYQVFDLTGKSLFSGVLSTGENALHVADLPSGLYFLELLNKSGEKVVRKIIVQ